jgi:hypothetical protein
VFEAHPEFKQQFMLRPTEGEDQELEPKQLYDPTVQGFKYLLCTMPEVDKNRYDLLKNGVKALHGECISKINILNMQTKAALTDGSFLSTQKDMDEAEARLKELYDTTKEKADQLLQDKLDEIEEAYKHYLEGDKSANDDEEAYDPGYDVLTGMRLEQ